MNVHPIALKTLEIFKYVVAAFVLTIIVLIVSSAFFGRRPHGKGDAKTKSNLAGARVAMEIYYDAHKNYGLYAVFGDCSAAGSIFTDKKSGMDQYTSATRYVDGTKLTCYSSPSAYAISASLKSAGGYWCIDSTGNSKSREDNIT